MRALIRLAVFIAVAVVSVVAVQQLIKRAHRHNLVEFGRRLINR